MLQFVIAWSLTSLILGPLIGQVIRFGSGGDFDEIAVASHRDGASLI